MNAAHRIVSTALLLAFGFGTRVGHAEANITPEAQGYFRNGVELLQADTPNYQDAYYQFKLAYEKSNSWKVLGNLGLCALKLERDGEALAFYDDYLKLGGRNVDRAEREAIERDLLLARGNGATVEFTASEEGELIDARTTSGVGGQHYALTVKTTLLVRAGTHTFTARDKAGRSLSWEATIAPGEKLSHSFDFDAPLKESRPASTGPRESAPPEVARTEPSRSSPVRTAGFVGVGVGVAAAAVGGVLALLAKGHESSALDRCNAEMFCHPSARAEFNLAVSQMQAANALLVSGAALSAVGVGLILFGGGSADSSASSSARTLELTPLVGSASGGLLASGRF